MPKDTTMTSQQILEGGETLEKVIKAGENAGAAWPYVVLMTAVLLLAAFAVYKLANRMIEKAEKAEESAEQRTREITDKYIEDLKRRKD